MMVEYDLVIRGGTVADGTGGAVRDADVAIVDGRIAAVGKVAGTGRAEEDARGLLVTPGFVDLHTHYDGQLAWSETLDPSSGHGATTVLAGNCGVGFAPCRAQDRAALVRLMEGVEDVPEVVMTQGLPWNWESFGDYLDAMERRPHDIDFAVLLPHAPLRVFAMGQRAVDLEPSTAADRALMRGLARQAMDAGASGFSTSRSIFHLASDGTHVPTLRAEEAELREIAFGMTDAGRGVLQAITFTGNYDVEEYAFLHRVAIAAGRPLSYSMLLIDKAPGLWREVARALERDNASGADIRMQVFNRPVGMILGLEATFNPFSPNPYYVEHLAGLPLAARVERMRDPIVRALLVKTEGAVDHPLKNNLTRFGQMFPIGDVAEYEPEPATSVAAVAAARGVSPYEVVYDLLLEREGTGKLLVASSNFGDGHLDETLELMRHERAVVALGDGGAHYGLICDASYSTYMLTHWVRDRRRGARLGLGEAVRMLTSAPAELQRFRDRGRIAVGLKADLNIIDLDGLKLFAPTVAHDLPGGGRRLKQAAAGYVATYVAGVAVRRDGQDTGARPGQLVRDAGLGPV